MKPLLLPLFWIMLDLVLILKKGENLNISTGCAMDCECFKKKHLVLYISSIKETILKCFLTFYFVFFLIRKNEVSNIRMKRYAQIGRSCQARFFNIKDWVAASPYIRHDCWSFSTIFIHEITCLKKHMQFFVKTLM